MGKVGQAVFEGQEFAQSYYNEPADKFFDLAASSLGKGTIAYGAAVDEFNTIGQELGEYFATEPFVPAKVDDDGIPY